MLVNVQFRPVARFSMNLMRRRAVLFGIIPTMVMRQEILPVALILISCLFQVLNTAMECVALWWFTILRTLTRHCMMVKSSDINWSLTSTS